MGNYIPHERPQPEPTRPTGISAPNPNLTPAQQRYIADAPEMLVGDVAKVTCSAGVEEKPVAASAPQSAPPWGNAVVTTPRMQGGGGSWLAQHPWWVLLAAGVGVALVMGNES